jgi:hypothetical protein
MTRQPVADARRGHWALGGDFTAGSPFLTAVPIGVTLPMAGAERMRVRFRTSGAGGTLAARFVRPDGPDTPYTQMQPVDVTVTANVEAVLDIEPHFGEGLIRLTFTPSGNGNITFCDASQT